MHLKQINSYWLDYVMMITPVLTVLGKFSYVITWQEIMPQKNPNYESAHYVRKLSWSLMLYEEPIYAPQEQEKKA